jgi:hypothetical protein
LHVLSNFLPLTECDFTALILQDLPSAADSIDQEILLQWLQASFEIGGVAPKWFS